jgi:hypothetical protein
MSSRGIIDRVLHQVPGEAISWIGPCPWTGGVAYGTESGKLFVGEDAWPFSSEAINGVAFSGDWGCVTTGEDVAIFDRDRRRIEKCEFGAHGVIPLKTGGFLAPLGPSGLMLAQVGPQGLPEVNIQRFASEQFIGYQACSLGVVDGIEFFACAARRGGIVVEMVPPLDPHRPPMVHGSGQFDIVDVCSLGPPLAAAALAIDGTLFFGRDLVAEPADMLSVTAFRGRAYSLRRIGDHLVILGSENLLVFPEFAANYLAGRRSKGQPYLIIPVQASEIFAIEDDLYTLEGDDAVSYPIRSLIDQHSEEDPAIEWSGHQLAQTSLARSEFLVAS